MSKQSNNFYFMFSLFQNTKLQLLIITLLTLLAYSNIFQNGFAGDDIDFILGWDTIRSFDNLGKVLTSESTPPSHPGVYRPLRTTYLMVLYKLFGENPLGYHLHSILVHLASTILVYFIIRNLVHSSLFIVSSQKTTNKPTNYELTNKLTLLPFISSLLFGLHPIHTESITFMTSAMDMTGVVFMLTSFYLYILTTGPVSSVSRQLSSSFASLRTAGRRQEPSLLPPAQSLIIASCFFALLAFFTYEMTLTLPLVMLLYNYCFVSTKSKPGFHTKKVAPYLFLVLAYLFIRIFFLNIFARGEYIGGSFYTTMVVMLEAFLQYLSVLFVPVNLTLNHRFAEGLFAVSFKEFVTPEVLGRYTITNPKMLLAFGLLAACLTVAKKTLKTRPLVTFSIAWFLITLLPVSFMIPQGEIMAERYLYIPSLGFVLLISFLLVKARDYLQQVQSLKFKVKNYSAKLKILNFNLSSVISEGKSLLILHSALLILVSFYFLQTYQRNKDWKDNMTLWKVLTAQHEDDIIAHFNVGDLYMQRGDYRQALAYFDKTLAIYPVFPRAQLYKGLVYQRQGDIEQSKKYFKKALELNPHFSDAQNALFVIANKYDGPGLSFYYPQNWDLTKAGKSLILAPAEKDFKVEITPEKIETTFEAYLKSRKIQYGTLTQEGLAKIPNTDKAYVRAWSGKETALLEFFLVKGDKVINITVSPPGQKMTLFDNILTTIRIEI